MRGKPGVGPGHAGSPAAAAAAARQQDQHEQCVPKYDEGGKLWVRSAAPDAHQQLLRSRARQRQMARALPAIAAQN